MDTFEIFLTGTPGLEDALLGEALELGFDATAVPGGVAFPGIWADVWRANLQCRGATRVLARVGSFMAFHLAQLDKRATKFDWAAVLRPDVPVRVEVTSRKSKIYHAGAASQRIEKALKDNGFAVEAEAPIQVKVRIDDNRVTLSVDTSGESLHKRGHKVAVSKAPMRETLAALMLRRCGYDGTEPVVDPMCGSGTFVIEAAEIARGLWPGRSRDFAFMQLASFEARAFEILRDSMTPRPTGIAFHGSDRDQGAIGMATKNADRAGVADETHFVCHPFRDVQPPAGPKGLVMINPPYGGRIGKKHMLYGLHAALGTVLKERFAGWRVGVVTSEPGLANTMGLPFGDTGPVIAHGGLKVRLYQTPPLP